MANSKKSGNTEGRRTKYDVVAHILKLIRDEPIKKTSIVYRMESNFTLIGNYLQKMGEKGLVTEVINPETRYQATEMGLDYLKHYEKLKGYFE
jgi:predicted transcriptional regulator